MDCLYQVQPPMMLLLNSKGMASKGDLFVAKFRLFCLPRNQAVKFSIVISVKESEILVLRQTLKKMVRFAYKGVNVSNSSDTQM